MKDLLIFLADGFEEIEALTVCDYLRRADFEVDLVSIMTDRRRVKGAHNIEVVADKHIDEINLKEYRGIYIPGGLPGATNLADDSRVKEIVKIYENSDRLVSSICAGPIVFDKTGILKAGKYTCYPGFEKNLETKDPLDEAVVRDKNVITAMGPSFAQVLAFELIEYLNDEKAAEIVKKDVLFDKLVDFIKEGKVK